jgi:ribosomal protein S18 acetylase RimI-like enzyme
MAVTIRYATKKDAELIADLTRTTFYETFGPDNKEEDMKLFMEGKLNKQLLMEEVGQEKNIFLLAYHDDEVAGYARLREDNNPPLLQGKSTIEVARLYAKTEMIGKGIGHALMHRAIEIAREKRKKMVWLGVWEKNHRAIEFYRRWGFEKFSDHEFILGNDIQNDWLMQKKLE